MSEAIKVGCVVVLMVAATTSAFMWADDRPSQLTWVLRFALPTLCIVAIAVFLSLTFRRDKVPDYLLRIARGYFNRNGFCFAARAENRGGRCCLAVYYQNQRDKPCVGRVALRPSRGFFMHRPDIQAVLFQIDCAPAAFGVARLAIPLPKGLQGKRQLFEVGASVDYFQGMGNAVRYREGKLLSTDCDFENARGELLGAAALLTGHIHIAFPVRIAISLPASVADDFTIDNVTEQETLWKIGDPPLVPTENDRVTLGGFSLGASPDMNVPN